MLKGFGEGASWAGEGIMVAAVMLVAATFTGGLEFIGGGPVRCRWW